MITSEMINSVKSECGAFYDDVNSKTAADKDSLIDWFGNVINEHDEYLIDTGLVVVKMKVKAGILARKLKEFCDNEAKSAKDKKEAPRFTWGNTRKSLQDKIKRSTANLDGCIYLSKFEDVFEFAKYGVTKLGILTKALGHYGEMLSMISKDDTNGIFSIKILTKLVDHKVDENNMDALHEQIITDPSSIYRMTLKDASKGSEFENEINELKGKLPYRVAYELMDEFSRKNINSTKIRHILDDLKSKQQKVETSEEVSKVRIQLKNLYEMERTPENQLEFDKLLDKLVEASLKNNETANQNPTAEPAVEGQAA